MADKEIGIRVTGDVGDITQKMDEVNNSIEQLSDKTVDLTTTGVDEATKSVDELGNELDEASEKAQKTGQDMEETGGMSVEAMAAATLAVAGFTAAMELAADSINDTQIQLGQLATQTGMAEGEMADLIAEISNATFPTEEALAYVKALHQAGVPNKSLADSATALDLINDATGVGYENVLKFTNSMVAMGLNLSDIPQYYDVIAYANDNMVGGFQTYINWMMKYDSIFKEMGLTIDQTAVVIAAATKKFGGGRAAYQGVNTAINESNGNMRVFAQMLDLQPSQLANASTAVNAYSGQLDKLADEEGEHKTWLQQISAYLEDVTTRYGGILGPMASFGGAMGALSTPIIAVNAVMSIHKNLQEASALATIKDSAAKVWNTTVSYAQRAATLAAAGASAVYAFATGGEVMATVTSIGSKVAHTAWSWLQTAATYAVAAAQWALNLAMSANPIGIVIMAIVALVGGLWYLYNTNEDVRAAIDGLWKGMVGFGQWLTQGFNGIISGVGNVWNGFVKRITDGVTFFITLPLRMAQWGYNAAKKFADGIKRGLKPITDALGGIAKFFPHSPPQDGPLAEITPGGMDSWMGTIVTAGNKAINNFDMSGLKPSELTKGITPPAMVGGNTTNTTGGPVINVNLGNVEINDDNTPESVGKGVADGLSKKLSTQANTAGVNVNITRG